MSEYTINYSVDGWPICKDGEAIPNKKAMLAELQQLQAERERLEAINLGLTKTLVEMEEEKAKLVEALEAFMDIVHDSGGVAGYHLNGAVAEWDEFQDVHDAAAALAAHRKKGSE